MFAKKYPVVLVALLAIQNVSAMELALQEDKHLGVARYLLKYPNGTNKQEDHCIGVFFTRGSDDSKKVAQHINNITGFSDWPAEMENGLAHCYYDSLGYCRSLDEEFIKEKTDYFFKFAEFKQLTQSGFYPGAFLRDNARQLFEDDLFSLMDKQDGAVISYDRYVKIDTMITRAKFFGHNDLVPKITELLEKNIIDTIKQMVKFLNQKKEAIRHNPENVLLYEFIRAKKDDFFTFKDATTDEREKQYRLKFNAREMFEQDVLSLINNQTVGRMSYDRYVEDYEKAHVLFWGDGGKQMNVRPYEKHRRDDINEEMQFFNEKKALIANKPFVLRLCEGNSFLSQINDSSHVVSYGRCIKRNVPIEGHLNISTKLLNELEHEDREWIIAARNSQGEDGQLVQVTPELLERWQGNACKDARSDEGIKNFKIDVADNPSGLGRKLCDNMFLIHAPLAMTSFMPDLMMYCMKDISSTFDCSANTAAILTALMSIVLADRVSYYTGEHLFPRLDNNHSDVAWLKTFFGDKVRAYIRRGKSFCNSTRGQWFLSCLGHILTSCQSSALRYAGYMAYGIKIPFYAIAASYLTWKKPIDRGAPETDAQHSPQKREGMKRFYRLGDLKKAENIQ